MKEIDKYSKSAIILLIITYLFGILAVVGKLANIDKLFVPAALIVIIFLIATIIDSIICLVKSKDKKFGIICLVLVGFCYYIPYYIGSFIISLIK